MEVSGQQDALASLLPGKKPGSHFIGNILCPKAGLDVSEKRKSHLPGHEPLTIQSVPWSLH